MAAKIVSHVHREKSPRMLVVVGAGHLSDLAEYLSRHLKGKIQAPTAELDRMPILIKLTSCFSEYYNYAFAKEELDCIINYDIKYCMRLDNG